MSHPWLSAAGGVARDQTASMLAAIGEAIERAASAQVSLTLRPRSSLDEARRIDAEQFALFTAEQRSQPGFSHGKIYDKDCPYGEVFSLQDNSSVWVPQPFITLQDQFATGIPTSSGLAAGPTSHQALLRSIQELIERDALMVTWLHGLPGRRVESLAGHRQNVERLDGEMTTFDLTPSFSPFPVAAVMGGIKKQGRWRYSLGVACRETWADAVEKAYLEWNQGVLFAGIYGQYVDVSYIDEPHKLRSFDEHAICYSLQPQHWHELPIWGDRTIHKVNSYEGFDSTEQALNAVRSAFNQAGIRVYYREITTIDALQAGVRVVKAMSPDMAMIFSHQEWPFLDKVNQMVASRYPELPDRSSFPFLMPHPLG